MVVVAGERQQAGLSLHQQVVGLRPRQRPRAVARDGGGDQPGIRGLERFRVEAEAGSGIGGDVVDEDVGPFEQGVEDPSASGGLDVELDGFLAAVEPHEDAGETGDLRVVVAGEGRPSPAVPV